MSIAKQPTASVNDNKRSQTLTALLQATANLRKAVIRLRFAEPVTHVYNPLNYAWAMHETYLRCYVNGPRNVLLLGMNPGPWGMAQTGIPFGEVAAVREWMKLDEPIDQPRQEHPKRPVTGLNCTRSEVSGRRLWGLFSERFPTPAAFFRGHAVMNYCPLVFLETSGKNRTPDKLPIHEREPLEAACDAYLSRVVDLLEPHWVIGVGKFAETKAKRVVGDRPDLNIGTILHPSPASPAANRGWAEQATRQMIELGIWKV